MPHTQRVSALFAVIMTIVDLFDREWIAERLGPLSKRDTVPPPILSSFLVVPFEALILHLGTDYQYPFQDASAVFGGVSKANT